MAEDIAKLKRQTEYTLQQDGADVLVSSYFYPAGQPIRNRSESGKSPACTGSALLRRITFKPSMFDPLGGALNVSGTKKGHDHSSCPSFGGAYLNWESWFCRPLPYHLAIPSVIVGGFFKKPPNALHAFFIWSGRRGSNSLPPPWQGGALPDELRPANGASGRSRTNDTRI